MNTDTNDQPPPRDDDRNDELDDSPVPDLDGPSTDDEDNAAA